MDLSFDILFAEDKHSDNSGLHESHRQKVETTLTRRLLQLEEQKAVLQEDNYIAGWICGMSNTL